jgi:hypothetical protein
MLAVRSIILVLTLIISPSGARANDKQEQVSTVDKSDSNKPVGEAVRSDGTLKEASEIEWLYSPSDETTPLPDLMAPLAKWRRFDDHWETSCSPQQRGKDAQVSVDGFG